MSDNFDATAIVGGAGRPLILKDRYEVERELGRGGMSVVYLAHDKQLIISVWW